MLSLKHANSFNFQFSVQTDVNAGYEITLLKLGRDDKKGRKFEIEFNRSTVKHGNRQEVFDVSSDVKGLAVFVGRGKVTNPPTTSLTDVVFVLLECTQRKALGTFPDEQKHSNTLFSLDKSTYYRLLSVTHDSYGDLNIADRTYSAGDDAAIRETLHGHSAHKLYHSTAFGKTPHITFES